MGSPHLCPGWGADAELACAYPGCICATARAAKPLETVGVEPGETQYELCTGKGNGMLSLAGGACRFRSGSAGERTKSVCYNGVGRDRSSRRGERMERRSLRYRSCVANGGSPGGQGQCLARSLAPANNCDPGSAAAEAANAVCPEFGTTKCPDLLGDEGATLAMARGDIPWESTAGISNPVGLTPRPA